MANIDEFTEDLEIISKLSDEPNDTDGLDAETLKKKFDEGPGMLKTYINETLLPQLGDILDELDDALGQLGTNLGQLNGLRGCSVVTEITKPNPDEEIAGDDDDDLPSSPAVQAYVASEITSRIDHISGGNMFTDPYDLTGKKTDIFAYADAIDTALRNLYRSIESRFDGTTGVLAQQYGGTGAATKAGGRGNLGITSGTADPSGGEDGDIYVKYV